MGFLAHRYADSQLLCRSNPSITVNLSTPQGQQDGSAYRAAVAGDAWVIPGRIPGEPLKTIDGPWRKLRTAAGLEDVRLHDLRHSFASRALALGESLPVIGKLLGHTQVQATARYAHLAEDSVKEAAARIAASIGADITHRSVLEGARPDPGLR